ncbi:MAG: hypothetical protein GF346_04235 [Candidatus Eisenbacteria bacterium]|nr:hypothetical protein [Candidatus Latescibacterota bacterium]MBD3301635.1 hypothetical protein [Candidatus Eisenbacteria bacterium]
MVSRPRAARRLDEKTFLSSLDRDGPPSSLFLAGPEVLLRDVVLSELEKKILAGQEVGKWNREVISAREVPLSDLNAGLRSVGLFSETRLVVLQEPERYGRAAKGDREELWGWFERPSAGIHLVLWSEKALWELERANQFLKGTLQRVATIVKLDHPTFERAVELIQRAARRRHELDLPPESARKLVEAVGPNLLELSHELDRLALRLGPGARVAPEQLENWLRAGLVGSVADLERAILDRDTGRALRYWEAVRRRYPAPAVTWMLASRHLDARWQRRGRGSSPAASGPFLSRLLEECYRLEFGVKRGEIPFGLQGVAFEEMLLRLGRNRAGGDRS